MTVQSIEKIYIEYAKRLQGDAELDLKGILSKYKKFVVSWSDS